ncbi:hypothetical protein AGABI2DRAFT_179366 [Agaricus bisporus var. bisporus H97]|uniref:hypothetical protein n=1 Tax=Agaricus bisporus var. bisporus (strain H97 / ATCC MYA-4626 / FGSC 10389) TaxID=936046 RepID=UPI00029F69A8|nr:hypothetical protein AGABI2DRAFT_179366 [Agaricus bisporus var. bisporus H97]EKV45907.1 hypothetical protein AGABI2DRAFT_179366 [Agaricus bisporus var. bisporus H97]
MNNLGIVILNNDWDANSAITAIKWRLVDEIVIRATSPSSPLIDWISRYKEIDRRQKQASKIFTPRPPHPPLPSLPFSELVRKTYSHPSYGQLRLCQATSPAPSSPWENLWGETFSIADQDCSVVVNSPAVKRILETTDLSVPTFISQFKSIFTTHIRLSHFSGNVFNATAIWTNSQVRMDEGYGSWDGGTWKDDEDVMISLMEFSVEWATEREEGLAFKGGIWGMGEGAREPLGSGKEAAEPQMPVTEWLTSVEYKRISDEQLLEQIVHVRSFRLNPRNDRICGHQLQIDTKVILVTAGHNSDITGEIKTFTTQRQYRENPHQAKLITPDVDEFIQSVIQQWNLTGLAIAVVRQDPNSPTGWIQEFGSYGNAKADGTPVTPDTLFSVASNSKLFTALSTGLLISNETLKEEKDVNLSWSSKAQDVFGETWGLMDEDASRGTSLQDMLSHRTGLPRHDASNIPRTLRYLRPSAEFREFFQYNNLLYDSLGLLPEVLVGQSLSAYVDHHIFKPLGLSNSTYSITEAEKRLLADGFLTSGQDLKRGLNGIKKPIVPFYARPGEESISAGSGGVISSARDMAKWVSMLLVLGRHPYQNRQIVPMDLVEHAATEKSIAIGTASFPEMSPTLYGAGQFISSYRGHEVVDHDGSTLGFSSSISRLPDDNLGIVILNNDVSTNSAITAIKWRLVDEIVIKAAIPGSPVIDWFSRQAS